LPHRHDFFAKTKVADDIASNFDPLTPLEFSEIFDFINYHYKVALRNSTKSGKHASFQNFVQTQPYLFAYYLCLIESPIEQQNLAFAQLPYDVKRESTASVNTVSPKGTSSEMPRKPQKHTARQQASALQASALQASALQASALQDMGNVSSCDCLAILFVVACLYNL
jgi:hypothetical protein